MYSEDISSIMAKLVMAKISICTCKLFLTFVFELALALFIFSFCRKVSKWQKKITIRNGYLLSFQVFAILEEVTSALDICRLWFDPNLHHRIFYQKKWAHQ